MKKLFLVVLCGVMLFGITGCGGETKKEETNNSVSFDYSKINTTSENIGKTVNYETVLNEDVKPSAYEGVEFTGDTGDLNEFEGEAENLNWVILAEDDENYMLTTVEATDDTIRLQGSNGYNNGVQALNAYCAKYYSTVIDGNKYVARNINMNDIEAYYKDKSDTWIHDTLGFENYNKKGVEAKGYQYYPSLYTEEIGSSMNGKLEVSETPDGYEPYNDSYKSDGSSTKDYLDTYYFAYTKDVKENFSNMDAYDIIFESGKSYWISTRLVSFYENKMKASEIQRGSRYPSGGAKFGIRMISAGQLTKADLMNSSSEPDIFHKYTMPVRPVVVIPKSEIEL